MSISSDQVDFVVVDVPSMLAQKVTISDENGTERPDPNWNQEAAESQFVFAEFLADRNLLRPAVRIERRPDLQIRWLEITETGRKFTRSDFHKWLVSVDKSGMSELKKREKLDKRWAKFLTTQSSQ